MQRSEELFLTKVKPQNAFCDESSFYKGKTKRKFKLALCNISDVYYFNIINSDRDKCDCFFTVDILKEDWLFRDDKYLWLDCSYCDVLRYDILNASDLVRKIRNKYNKFSLIGRLCEKKFNKILKLIKKSKYMKRTNSDIKKLSNIVTREIAKMKIKELKLN